MGHILSKIFKTQINESKINEVLKIEAQTQTSQIEDFQATTNNMFETPISVKKNSFKEYDLESLKSKMLNNLNLDPRSPTVGIYRTPIVIKDLNCSDSNSIKCDSPVSVYSVNDNSPIIQDIRTPFEPSVNVSGFEKTKEVDEELDISNYGHFGEQALRNEKEPLKILNEPNTFEALKLLKEIQMAEEENFLKKARLSTKKNKKGLHQEFKLGHAKSRTPLSNITSSANSPSNKINSNVKFSTRKVLPDTGSENSFSSKPQHLMQWDQNNTVII